MGASQSTAAKCGQQVLAVQPKSPAERAGLRPIFDYIVAANGAPLSTDGPQLVDTLKGNLDKEVRLQVYNTREESLRECVIVPTLTWGGGGCAGLSIRFSSFESAADLVWHITEVYPQSPALEAGLCAGSDYIVGSPEVLFNDSEDFYLLINSSYGRRVELYVYSAVTDRVRVVAITPKRWAGSGYLGCNVGSGILHRVPAAAKPGDLVYAYPPPPSPRSNIEPPSPHSAMASAAAALGEQQQVPMLPVDTPVSLPGRAPAAVAAAPAAAPGPMPAAVAAASVPVPVPQAVPAPAPALVPVPAPAVPLPVPTAQP
eukprot:m51a1_g183 Golgi reassembly and stacking protein (315) ;mRNA; r:600183-601614